MQNQSMQVHNYHACHWQRFVNEGVNCHPQRKRKKPFATLILLKLGTTSIVYLSYNDFFGIRQEPNGPLHLVVKT
jgi:hypothetical protein